ncbi:diguanylate cyclase [Ramlibacter sp. CrO1]|uniref:Diguanylate cyclase n=1 Tax=Ramlibacter algicola TaxID=2795217 RepID=A0A934US23_9BURK|nr:diguanylate cyclase [Ramlibacter algicola]
MGTLATAFWGAYFGAVSLSLVAALIAFTRSARRVALTGSLAAALSALYVLVYLGWVPVQGDLLMRLQAVLAVVCASVLGLLLFRLLGLLRDRAVARRVTGGMVLLAVAVLLSGSFTSQEGGLLLAAGMAWLVIPAAFAVSVRSARLGGRLGWFAVSGVASMSIPVVGLTWFALNRDQTPSWVHAVSATAATAYLVTMASAMWERYAYLRDVREAMVYGPAYDPITRMRTHAETGAMVGDAFARLGSDGVAVVVVSIANLQALEQLHGRAACNHGLFLCASRLRRSVPPGIEAGRLGDDAFLLMSRRPARVDHLNDVAHEIARRLSKPVLLGTSQDLAALEASRTEWMAEVGVGVLVAPPGMRPGVAIAGARAMSRTAWSYASRVAWYDAGSRQITELPLPAGAAG